MRLTKIQREYVNPKRTLDVALYLCAKFSEFSFSRYRDDGGPNNA